MTMLIVSNKRDGVKKGETDAEFWVEYAAEEPEFLIELEEPKKSERKIRIKYSDDQPRDEIGRWTDDGGSSGGGGKDQERVPAGDKSRSGEIDISDYPKKAEDVTTAQRLAQAEFSDIKSNLEKDLTGLDPSGFNRASISGTVSDARSTLISNAKGELGQYSHYLAGDTSNRARDFIDHMDTILQTRELSGLDAKLVDGMLTDCINKLVYQEVESNRQQFTDHGIRHVVGDVLRADAIMLAASNGEVGGMERLMSAFALLNHDIGYTTPLVREGGLRGILVSSDHDDWGAKILEQQASIYDEGKGIFTRDQYDQIVNAVKTHDSPEINTKDLFTTSIRLADNLSLFSDEKLPGMFRYVANGKTLLSQLGDAARAKDQDAFDKQRENLHAAIDKTNISSQLKRDLKAATQELNYFTHNYALGTLAGNISSIKSAKDGGVDISIKYNSWDAFLQQHFDMGQKQTQSLLKSYGETDLSKTTYRLGGFATINIIGFNEHSHRHNQRKGIVIKYSDDQPRDENGQWTSTGGGGATTSDEKRTEGAGYGRAHLNDMANKMMAAAKSGGFTLDFQTETPVESGFAVSMYPERSGVFEADKIQVADVAKWLGDNREFLSKPGVKVGGWLDEDTSKIWLDAVHVFGESERETAIEMGKKHNQISIADLSAIKNGDWDNAFIKTGGTGKAATESRKRGGVFMLFDGDVTAEAIMAAIKKHTNK